jgi:hypothetical protein
MWVNEIAHQMALAPLVAVAVEHWRGKRPDVAFWWLGSAFGVSWLADTAAHWVSPWLVSAVYPVSQAALIAVVFLGRGDSVRFLKLLVWVAALSILTNNAHGPEIILRTVAWGGVTIIALDHAKGWTQRALVVSFGLGLVAWAVHSFALVIPTWYAYQGTRAVGIGLFCYAVVHPRPVLHVVQARAA